MPIENSTVTLKEVARLAGVSVSTVSRYISGTHLVTPEKQAAIDGAIKRLNYRPNLVARGLATGRTMTVGVLTQELHSTYFNEVMRGVEDALAGHDYETIFVNGHWNQVEEERRLVSLIGRRVDGVILLASGLDDSTLDRHGRTVPTVLLGAQCGSLHVHSVSCDHVAGARLAVQHLVELGHRRIAFIKGPQGRGDADERLRGYREALEAAGLPYDEGLVASGNYLEPGGLQAMYTLLDRGAAFTAVFAANDDSAYGAILALSRRGLRVPEDMSVVGYDDVPHSAFTVPPLTSVRQPLPHLSRAVANAVVALIEGRRPPRPPMPPSELVVRESTRARPLAPAA
jgi:LacI family transcriptional regulator